MNTLLVYPEFPDTFWSFKRALAFAGKRASFPPLGLLTLSAMLPPSWNRRLIDMNVRPLTLKDIAWADVLMVSAMYVQKDSLRQVIELGKAHGKKVVVGGPYTSVGMHNLTAADHIFVGEVESTFAGFVDDLSHGEAARIYQSKERPTLDRTPIPDFRLAEIQAYSDMSVQYSRGCPFTCEFCDIIEIYGRVPRTKSNEQMLAELDELLRVGWRGDVFIVDDNFIGNKRSVRTLLPHLAEWSERHRWPFAFATEASINLADDDELLGAMRRAGFRRIFIGIETPDEGSLREAQKGQNTRRDMLYGIRKVQSYGMEVMGGFIVGFDNDPDDIFEKQIDFIRASAIPLAMVGLLTAAPHTQLWRRLEREGRLLTGFTGNNTDGVLNFTPRMEPGRLVAGYRRILQALYNSRAFYRRALDSLARVGDGMPEPEVNGGLFNRLTTLGRVLCTLGIRDPERGEFWRYLGRVLLDHRGRIPQAIILAAMGYHFRKLTDDVVQNRQLA